MLQPFYKTRPDVRGEYEEYFVDSAGTIVTRERVRDLGRALTLRTDMLSTNTFLRSPWSSEVKRELAVILAAVDVVAINAVRNASYDVHPLVKRNDRARMRHGRLEWSPPSDSLGVVREV